MERFGYSTGKANLYSDSGDRYGFDQSSFLYQSTISTNDFSLEKKPQFKITVSSTGKVEEKPLPPIEKKKSPNLLSHDRTQIIPHSQKNTYEDKIVLSIDDLKKAFASPWMREYKQFGESLLKALRDEPFPNENIPQTPISDYIKSRPYFIDCSPDPRNVAIFNGHNIYISLYTTEENRIKKSLDILPFDGRQLKLPFYPIIFTIYDPQDDDYLGRAHGQITNHKGETIIRLLRIEDFAKNNLTWDDIPVGSHLITTVNIEGSIYPLIRDETKGSKEEDRIITCSTEQSPQGNNDNSLVPYFEGSSPTERNYFRLDGDQAKAYLEITTKPPGVIILPIKGHQKDFLANIVDQDENLIALVRAHLNPEGKVNLGEIVTLNETSDSQKQLTWQELPVHGIVLIIELN